jgi:hypothetical protein
LVPRLRGLCAFKELAQNGLAVAAGLACSSPTWCRAFAAFALLRNSRKTDSLPAAKSAEFLFRLAPPEAAFALLSGSNHLVWIDDELLRRALVEIDVALRRLIE